MSVKEPNLSDAEWTPVKGGVYDPKPVFDPVEYPQHYASGAVECIDAIEAALGPDGFSAFLRGQVIKYNWRLGMKGPAAEDAGKARWYAARLEEYEKKRVEHREPRA